MTPSREQDELLKLCDRIITGTVYSTFDFMTIVRELRTRLSSPSVPEAFNVLRGIVDIWDDGPDGDHYKPGALREAIEDARRFLAAPPLTPSRPEVPATKAEKDLLDKNHGEGNWEITKKYLVPPSHHSGAVVDKNLQEQIDEFITAHFKNWSRPSNYECDQMDIAAKEFYKRGYDAALRHPSSMGASSGDATKSMLASPPSASAQGCEYDNQHCPKRSDETHCAHWWDGAQCCACGHEGTDAVAKQWLESINDDGYRTDSERCAARHLLEMLAAQPSPPTAQEPKS